MARITGYGRVTSAAIVAGLLSGVGAIVFHGLADRFGDTLINWAEHTTWMHRLPIVLAVPALGLLFVGIVLQRVPEARYGGVREVFEAIEHHSGFVPVSRLVNVALSALVLGFGGSVGPEGPMVQLGAVAGSWVGRTVGLTREELRTLVRAGAAAGVAAAFRSPAGGILLTLEIFGARFNKDLPPIAIAAVFGYATRTMLLGDAYPFKPAAAMQPMPVIALVLLVPAMGLLAAPTGHVFIRMFERTTLGFPRRWPLPVTVALGGLLVGTIAIAFPQVLSAGYPVIDEVLRGGFPVSVLVLLLLLKMVATSITFGSGAVGGLFAPTLVMGALYGGAFGYAAHAVAPAVAPQPELFVLLGMVVMFGSIVKGYWSGLLLVADLSGCYHQLLLPGLVAGGISYVTSWELHDRSVFGMAIDPARAADGAAEPEPTADPERADVAEPVAVG